MKGKALRKHSLHEKTAASVLLISDFTVFVKQYDVCCFAETKLNCYDIIPQINGYVFKSFNSEKCQRKSGGVGLFLKERLLKDFQLLENKCNENYLWFKFKNENCIFGIIYFPPESSNYSSLDLFNSLEKILLDFSVTLQDVLKTVIQN